MNELIWDIFNKNKKMFQNTEWAIHFFHVQNLDGALRYTSDILAQLMELIPLYIQAGQYFNADKVIYTEESLLEICQMLLSAQEQSDYVLLSDYFELYLLPLLREVQEKVGMDEGGVPSDFQSDRFLEYQIEYTSSGAMTLKVEKRGRSRYFHSNKSPYKEALELAESWYDEEKTEYIVCGLGLGYHIEALAAIDENITIHVYESDRKVIDLFEQYGAYEIKDNPNVKIEFDLGLQNLFKRIGSIESDSEFVIHEPSIAILPTSKVKERLENYFIQYSSVKNQLKLLNGNFRKNINSVSKCIDEIKEDFTKKTMYLIGAGPSLDKNYLELKKVDRAESVIVSTGTAFWKLINAGIRPDYVIETDANRRIRWHFSGVEEEKVPMLMLSTTAHVLNEIYAGKKYLVFQNGYEKSEIYAKEHGCTLFETGGSVMTTALDIGIRMGCKKIVFLGLDLGYTDNFAHASDTTRRNVPEGVTDLRKITDIYGQTMYTNRSLDMYREWIEKRIRRESNSGIGFIDATEGGALIKGTQIMTMSEVLAEKNRQ